MHDCAGDDVAPRLLHVRAVLPRAGRGGIPREGRQGLLQVRGGGWQEAADVSGMHRHLHVERKFYYRYLYVQGRCINGCLLLTGMTISTCSHPSAAVAAGPSWTTISVR